MMITAGIHFTKNNISLVFMNRRFKTIEEIKKPNNAKAVLTLEKYLLQKYPTGDIRLIVEKEHFHSQTFPKILFNHGYVFDLIPPIISYDPVFNLFMAIPKKTRFYKAFIKAAMLWIPGWKSRLLTVKKQEYDCRQLTLF